MSHEPLDVTGNLVLLRQGESLLDRLTDAQYSMPCRKGWQPVGAQYRHILEHYQSFLAGLPAGRIDYDARPRDARLEVSRFAAKEVTLRHFAGLGALDGAGDWELLVRMDCGDKVGTQWRLSSVGRELQFLCSHTVHHFALIALLLDDAEVELGAEFGVAPSTLAYQRTASECAP